MEEVWVVEYPRAPAIDEQQGIRKGPSHTILIQPGTYQHYKGKKYRVLGVAKHSETLEDMGKINSSVSID